MLKGHANKFSVSPPTATRAGLMWVTWFVCVLLLPGAIFAGDSSQRPRQRLDKMSSVEKEQLRAKRARFKALPADEQQRIRQLHQQISSEPQLEQITHAYFSWLKTLPAIQVAELKSLSTPQRIVRIKEIRGEQQQQLIQRLASKPLSKKDGQAVLKWATQFVERHQDEILTKFSTDLERRYHQIRNSGQRKRWLLHAAWQRHAAPMPSGHEIQQLFDQLSPAAQQELQALQEPGEKKQVIRRWVQTSFVERFGTDQLLPIANEKQLDGFYRESLTRDQKEHLDRLPGAEFQRELQQLFYNRPHMPQPAGPRRHFRRKGPRHHPPRRDRPPN
ncbi:MAG: hypothetical protein CMJ81_19705 [Planctomycetaceae bacterium]|nr:hypothetical protein [Planctomycetaceae bacterium]MBP63173.1 hypothetical protein [Planctomycetaceae bacterium]